MYTVYWMVGGGKAMAPHARQFASADMASALKFMEELRSRQRAGEAIAFVTMASEHPDLVGHAGVADPSPHYSWKKRRR